MFYVGISYVCGLSLQRKLAVVIVSRVQAMVGVSYVQAVAWGAAIVGSGGRTVVLIGQGSHSP